MEANKDYIFSSKAYWRNGGYGPMMSALGGTLGLTATGRLVFTLDTGKILFSAPVALIKRKNESMYGWMRFVVGPRLYTLQFYVNDRSAAAVGIGPVAAVGAGLADASQGRNVFGDWVDQLDRASTITPDNEQLVAAVSTPSILRARKFGMDAYRQSGYVIILSAFIAVLSGLIIGLLSVGQTGASFLASVVGGVITVGAYVKLRSLNRRRQQIDAQPHLPQDTSVQQADILPAGTLPTGSFGLTTGKQILLGPLFLAGGILVVFVPVFIGMVIYYIVKDVAAR